MAEKINEKLDRSAFIEERYWVAGCPKCKYPIEITDAPDDEGSVYCEQCKTFFELEG